MYIYDVYDTMYIIRCMSRGDLIMRYIQHLHTSSGQLGSSTYAVVYVMARCTIAQKTSKHVQNKWSRLVTCNLSDDVYGFVFVSVLVFFSVLINDRRAYLMFFLPVLLRFLLEKMSDMSDVSDVSDA